MNETTQNNLNISESILPRIDSIKSEIEDIIQAVEITSDVLSETKKDVNNIKASMLSKKDILKLKPKDGKDGINGKNGNDGKDGLDGIS